MRYPKTMLAGLALFFLPMAATANTYQLNINKDFPATAVAQITCEYSAYNIYLNLKQHHPDKVSYTMQDLKQMHGEITRAQQEATTLLQTHYTQGEIESFGAELQVMLDNLDANARRENWPIGYVVKKCSKQAVNIGNKYDRQLQLKHPQKARLAAPAESAGTPVQMKQEALEITSPNITADASYNRLLSMDKAKPSEERTKDDWQNMDNEALKLLEEMSK